MFAWSIIFTMLAISAAVIFFMVSYSDKTKWKYPNVDCNKFEKEYNTTNSGMDITRWRNDAGIMYTEN